MNPHNEPYKSFNGFGVDVAIKRTDDLDKRMLEHLRTKNSASVLDLGCGAGGQSVRMAEIGAKVLAVDIYDFSEEFAEHRQSKNLAEASLKFVCFDITKLPSLIKEENFSDASMQRTLHYLRYTEAVELLVFLRKIITDKLFISVTGMSSAVGENYAGKNVPIESRFVKLDSVEADMFQIQAPVCLYTEVEFVDLLKKTGWQIEEVWQSAFGNVKAVCK